jgi:hypothetical protein
MSRVVRVRVQGATVKSRLEGSAVTMLMNNKIEKKNHLEHKTDNYLFLLGRFVCETMVVAN